MNVDCASLSNAPESIAQGLRAIDCASGVAIQTAFGRFFGPDGALGGALTILLTLYVGLFAIKLLTGRGGLSINTLTPRMLGLGLALTFATSWLAYQNVALNLALGAPDEIARILVGSKGSATMLFANRLDEIFNAIANAAQNVPVTVPTLEVVTPGDTVSTKGDPLASASDLLWLAALMLLLGTVGVLLVAKIALAAMLALGPIFIIMSLFAGTRGLFEGWLKAIVMLAITPLLAVILGGGTIALIGPMVDDLAGGPPDMRMAVTIFLGASVHVILMIMAIKASTMLVSGWRLPSATKEDPSREQMQNQSIFDAGRTSVAVSQAQANEGSSRDRVQAVFANMTNMNANSARSISSNVTEAAADRANNVLRLQNTEMPRIASRSLSATDNRTRTIGQRYRKPLLVSSVRSTT